jgi:hypothetical protein
MLQVDGEKAHSYMQAILFVQRWTRCNDDAYPTLIW